ncbi:MAG: formimidoylglutamate deiminase [Gammaproteobacteria bacterium]|nr:formimidoylglutamate deiminase [Gammaproteobacteria bacterium]
MTEVFARKALLHNGWAADVRLTVSAGRISGISHGAAAERADCVVGVLIPGICNAHSHAFQRALAGRTEERAPAGQDNFWTWRQRMYELAGDMDATLLAAIAAQAYSEMLESGYTSVAEFHYLHRDRGNHERDAMFAALATAVESSGIRMTYVPVLYERAGFEESRPLGKQLLFALDADHFLAHHARAAERQTALVNVAIGAHSLRAVSEESLRRVAKVAGRTNAPLHLHIAEQQREVDQCMAANGRRPVRWLLENFDVDARWCLVHATHMDVEETQELARSGAVVCLCPSTEANLGDGLFPLHDFLSHGGRVAIGSDSHVSINPFEELRWLEYGQRLASQSRNVVSLQEAHVGRELYTRVLEGGAAASGQPLAGIQAGAPADLVALYDDDPMLIGHDDASLLDALVFSGYRLPIDRVMVNGDWRVIDGNHVERTATRAAFAAALARLGAAQ